MRVMPTLWSNWVFYICVPTGIAIAASACLLRITPRRCSLQIAPASLQHTVHTVIAAVVLLQLVIGNYAIVRRFSPPLFWVCHLSFSLVAIVSGCAAWIVYARTSLFGPVALALFLPIVLYSILFFCGELIHLALFYYRII
jgi:hypothetical protein